MVYDGDGRLLRKRGVPHDFRHLHQKRPTCIMAVDFIKGKTDILKKKRGENNRKGCGAGMKTENKGSKREKSGLAGMYGSARNRCLFRRLWHRKLIRVCGGSRSKPDSRKRGDCNSGGDEERGKLQGAAADCRSADSL